MLQVEVWEGGSSETGRNTYFQRISHAISTPQIPPFSQHQLLHICLLPAKPEDSRGPREEAHIERPKSGKRDFGQQAVVAGEPWHPGSPPIGVEWDGGVIGSWGPAFRLVLTALGQN